VNLAAYLESLTVEERRAFARRCGTSLEYLRQLAAGIRTPKVGLAITISRESAGLVTCEALVPGVDWAYLRAAPAAQERAA
jgi:DNA-binding transcriptional regulator YdaS (Cro superfamily)